MAKYSNGATLGVTKQQMLVAQMLSEGRHPDQIARICFDVRAADGVSADAKKVAKARALIRKWMRDPKVQEAYQALLREFIMPEFAHAVRRQVSLIDDPNGWLAAQAARDTINRFYDAMMGGEDREIVVRVEGGPVLGKPDAEEES